jgi:hypothetical protein
MDVELHHLVAGVCFIFGFVCIQVGLRHETIQLGSGDSECAMGSILVVISIIYFIHFLFTMAG